jgi:hypothetical protein
MNVQRNSCASIFLWKDFPNKPMKLRYEASEICDQSSEILTMLTKSGNLMATAVATIQG